MSCALFVACDECRCVRSMGVTDRGELGEDLLKLRRRDFVSGVAALLRRHGADAGGVEGFIAAHADHDHRVRLCAMEEGGDVLLYRDSPG